MLTTQPKRFVFVLMPFDEAFDDVYRVGIKPACQAADAYCERVDEQIFYESILERIYNQISKADLIVSDMTRRNPNVFYETGYAHALGKKVILLTQNADDIPFDLKHYPHIVYAGKISTLRDELEKRVSWYMKQPASAIARADEKLEFYSNGQRIMEGEAVVVPAEDTSIREDEDSARVWLNLSVHNPTFKTVDASSLSISLILPRDVAFLDAVSGQRNTRLPDGRVLAQPWGINYTIAPQGWTSHSFLARVGPLSNVIFMRK